LYWAWGLTNSEKYEEIEGMVQAIDIPELNMPLAVLINNFYELVSWCTSTIVKTDKGEIIHSRNLDFDDPQYLRDMAYRANFTKDGKVVYLAVLFAGLNGIYTGYKEGAFSISMNQRAPMESKFSLIQNIAMGFMGFTEISWACREALRECDSFDCAERFMSTQKVNSDSYVIIAGTKGNQGVVLTRSRYQVLHKDSLSDSKWFLVQTNSDHWADGCTHRCLAATMRLTNLT
jgi:hypothetical protein